MTEIVAEISGNHGGKLENALELMAAAKIAGADAVKFQCFEPKQLAAKRSGIYWNSTMQYYTELFMLYSQTHTPKEWFPDLIAHASLWRIPWFSSVFHPDDVAFLEALGCPRYKISAYEMLDGDLINAVKATGKPIVMSVRPQPSLTILLATDYAGNPPLTGQSDHSPKGEPWCPSPMIERHLRLPAVDTPDATFSSTPDEFAAYVAAIRKAAA